jgi:hypothetical protein
VRASTIHKIGKTRPIAVETPCAWPAFHNAGEVVSLTD